MQRLLLLLLLPLALAACTWTMSSQRRQRISDCLARCEASSPEETGQRPIDPGHGFVDQRTECERQCHSLK